MITRDLSYGVTREFETQFSSIFAVLYEANDPYCTEWDIYIPGLMLLSLLSVAQFITVLIALSVAYVFTVLSEIAIAQIFTVLNGESIPRT